VPTRVKVRNRGTGEAVEMDLEPDKTVQEVLESAAGYWGQDASAFALRRGRRTLRGRDSILDANVQDRDELEFLPMIETSRPTLLLEAPGAAPLEVTEDVTLGRNDLAGLLPDPIHTKWVSRRHFTITFREGSFFLEDGATGVGSKNGTTINGRDVHGQGAVPLRDGDTVGVGGALDLRVRIVGPE